MYHYTTASSVCGILRTREFWLTKFDSLNDSSEILYGLEKVRERIKVAVESESDDRTKTRLAGLANWIATPLGLFDFNPDFMAPSTAAVCSSSELGNDLAQWRAYGYSGEGYALRVRPAILQQIAAAESIALVRCRYEDADIESLVDPVLHRWADEIRGGRAINLDENFWREIVSVAAQIKHRAFAGEREWRLVRSHLLLAAMETQVLNGRIRALVKLNLEQQRGTVQSVVIGPHHDVRSAVRALGPLLEQSIGGARMFELSGIPYRAR